MKTEEDVKKWLETERESCRRGLQDCDEVPEFMKKPGSHFEEVWFAGCWLNEHLRLAGASEKEVSEIGFAHGQRSVFGNAVKWAVAYLNEFEKNREVKDKPGEELADEINNAHIQKVDGVVVLRFEKND